MICEAVSLRGALIHGCDAVASESLPSGLGVCKAHRLLLEMKEVIPIIPLGTSFLVWVSLGDL